MSYFLNQQTIIRLCFSFENPDSVIITTDTPQLNPMLKFLKSVQTKILYTRTSYYNLYQLCVLCYHHSNRHLGDIPALATGILTKLFSVKTSSTRRNERDIQIVLSRLYHATNSIQKICQQINTRHKNPEKAKIAKKSC